MLLSSYFFCGYIAEREYGRDTHGERAYEQQGKKVALQGQARRCLELRGKAAGPHCLEDRWYSQRGNDQGGSIRNRKEQRSVKYESYPDCCATRAESQFHGEGLSCCDGTRQQQAAYIEIRDEEQEAS